ncbi:MAG: hypothetical protein J7641_12005 [Cyanobacteria bacterium SID2]|nr:hypothetical protein [Cyanobacteria bacterium SID2]MBP0003027.1 hypothetical protein [Cyanobacteria bacterium SBC]
MSEPTDERIAAYDRYRQVIDRTTQMVGDNTAQALVRDYGFNIVNVMWEDTGRYDNSAVGPNISDLTIQVQQYNPHSNQYELHLMPVIRYPNFTDFTADIPIDRFSLLVGNEKGESLNRVSLSEVLDNLRDYLSEPDSWESENTSLLAERDTHVLVSAQACFLPIPQGDKAQFNPVLFNYQSYQGDPAVLTLLATREGTSVTIIDNVRDAFEAGPTWGQRLFFNQDGERASLTGQRLSDFQTETAESRESNEPVDEPTTEAAGQSGLNMVMVIQVPLKQKYPMQFDDTILAAPMEAEATRGPVESDVEDAVIGHGDVEGPFTEIDGLAIERDPDFPIRVTVQFYKATSNGIVSVDDLDDIHEQITRVYVDADYVGSLVVDGETDRPTEYQGSHQEPEDWWDVFWERHRQNTGQTPAETLEMLRRLFNQNRIPEDV